jgi:hypothetical protein
MSDVKYPDVTVQLSGQDGNAFTVLARVAKALRRGGVPNVEVDVFNTEATAGDYDQLLQTCMRWVNVE